MEQLKNKRAYFFTADALIALILIVSVMYLVPQTYVSEKASISVMQDDVIKVLSNLKIDQVNSSLVKEMISTGAINKTNISVIEQISEFWVLGDRGRAINLTKEMFIPLNESDNVGIWLGSQFISGKNKTAVENADEIDIAKELISGVESGKAVTGYSARAFLKKGDSTAIRYIGGYVGDGDPSLTINLEEFYSISSAYLEVATNTNFTLFINGNSVGQFTSTGNSFVPSKYNISTLNYFRNGTNDINFKSVNPDINLFIAGGYIKIIYKPKGVIYHTFPLKYEFPGVNKVINIYDSFFSPALISTIQAYLHYKSNFTTYLSIGNTTIFERNTSVEEQINLNNANFSNLNYSSISFKTVPLRFGLLEVQEIIGKQGNADVILITDLSGSMNSRMDSDNTGTTRNNCSDPLIYDSSTKRVSLAKCLDKEFIDAILNSTGNRVALSAFYADSGSPYKGRVYEESLTANATYLKGKVNLYSPQGGTCICCSENNAYNILNSQSNSTRDRYVVVMTDGIPTHTCQASSGCTGTRTGLPSDEGLWLGYGAGCYGGSDDCSSNNCDCAITNTNWSSCRINQNLNTTVHSIGFGPVSTCDSSNRTLTSIAKCGKGNYYASSNATVLKMIYENISSSIINISFVAQTAYVVGNISSLLYNDSHIAFNYTLPALPFGNIVTLESPPLGNNSEINFTIPQNSSIIEAVLVSYSGNYWTRNVFINNYPIYNLSEYGENFVKFGDPYHIYLPTDKIILGNNSVRVELALAPEQNSTAGSSSDKVVYTIATTQSDAYSTILPNAEGCLWQIGFEDSSSLQIAIPTNYTGTKICNLTNYDENDAIDLSIYNLLKSLDFNNNNIIDAKFTSEELYLDAVTVKGIPYMWFSTVQARSWRR